MSELDLEGTARPDGMLPRYRMLTRADVEEQRAQRSYPTRDELPKHTRLNRHEGVIYNPDDGGETAKFPMGLMTVFEDSWPEVEPIGQFKPAPRDCHVDTADHDYDAIVELVAEEVA